MRERPIWDGFDATAGGPQFGSALASLAAEREVSLDRLAAAAGLDAASVENMIDGRERAGLRILARFALELRLKPIEFLQRTSILSLEAYAFGLDPLFFLPEGPVRYDARIYMREINPRHRVPEADMTRRNPVLRALEEDDLLDAAGKTEIELAYLLCAAVAQTGGTL